MLPRLSVVIPTYKRTDSLKKLLDCLGKQEDIDLEIIIVDQNAPDFFTEAFLSKLTKFTYIHQSQPNASLARNNGFKISTAPYVLFIDDDLLPDPDFCIKGVTIFNNYPLVKCFVPMVYTEDEKGLWIKKNKKKIKSAYPGNDLIFSITDNISAAVFFERSYYKLSGGFDPYLFEFAKASEDVELFLRMQQNKLVLWFVSFLEIFHDEKSEGGCEMRTAGYWVSREKNARAMALRLRIHNKASGNLSIANIIQLSRSYIFNKAVLKSGLYTIIKEAKLLTNAIKESKIFYNKHKKYYSNNPIDFLL